MTDEADQPEDAEDQVSDQTDETTDAASDEAERERDAFESEFEFSDDEHLFDEAEFEAEGWSLPRDPEAASRLLKSMEGYLPDILRRAIDAGVDRVGSREELRELLSEKNMPQEVVRFMVGQVDATRREVTRIISKEVRNFLEDVDLGGEIAKILTSLALEVRMEVCFKATEDSVRPNLKGKVGVKQSNEEGGSDESDEKRSRWSFRRRGADSDDSDDEDASDDE